MTSSLLRMGQLGGLDCAGGHLENCKSTSSQVKGVLIKNFTSADAN